jgi:hypothetical protein
MNEADDRRGALDIDIRDCTDAQRAEFERRKKNRFKGHKTKRADQEVWKFKTQIEVPVNEFAGMKDCNVFEGTIVLTGLMRELELAARVTTSASVEMKVLRAADKKP